MSDAVASASGRTIRTSAPLAHALPVAALLVLAACGGNGPPEGLSPPDLFAWSQTNFEEEDYGEAMSGFQAFILRDPLSPLTDSAQYMLAEAQLRDGKELEAADEFSRLATGRPNSPWADDAQYGACRAYQEASPKVSLSQEFTRRAIEECERLLQFFPSSELVDEARRQLHVSQAKLAEKSFSIGEYYFRAEFYESARLYYEKALSEQPSPELMPRLLAQLYESYTNMGFDNEARSVRERLLTEFPDSEEARRVEEDGDG